MNRHSCKRPKQTLASNRTWRLLDLNLRAYCLDSNESLLSIAYRCDRTSNLANHVHRQILSKLAMQMQQVLTQQIRYAIF